jgi:hypothetical protein
MSIVIDERKKTTTKLVANVNSISTFACFPHSKQRLNHLPLIIQLANDSFERLDSCFDSVILTFPLHFELV